MVFGVSFNATATCPNMITIFLEINSLFDRSSVSLKVLKRIIGIAEARMQL